MYYKQWISSVLLLFCGYAAAAQVVGGEYALEYLRLSDAPHVSALGGINVASPDNDIAFALQNPALMRPGLHNELSLNYNNYYAGINIMNLQYGYYVPHINTAFVLGVQYLNYGTFTQTDNVGNVYGDFRALDYAISLGASQNYGDHWRYGAALKYAHSMLFTSTATAVLADVGIDYMDTTSGWNVGAVAKNMGAMVKEYDPTKPAEPLPFDLQMGVSKQFKHLPLRLMATLHHIYEWDIRYDNPADVVTNTFVTNDTNNVKESSHFGDKLFRHFIFAAELTLSKRLLLTISYNDLMRSELALQDRPAMAGFSFGAGLYLNKLQVHYARSYYHLAGATNEIGITMQLNKLFGVGNGGDRMHWNEVYPDWLN